MSGIRFTLYCSNLCIVRIKHTPQLKHGQDHFKGERIVDQPHQRCMVEPEHTWALLASLGLETAAVLLDAQMERSQRDSIPIRNFSTIC